MRQKNGFEEAYCHTFINCAVHMLFLIESLLLKKAVPVVKPKMRAKKLHLLVEEFRPWGCREALAVAKMLIHDDPDLLKALEKLVKATLLRSANKAEEVIKDEDIEHILDLLLIVVESGSYLRWGEGREFI
ncbi:MAG: hypothetical protein AB1796_11895 [Bacillota bacterium]